MHRLAARIALLALVGCGERCPKNESTTTTTTSDTSTPVESIDATSVTIAWTGRYGRSEDLDGEIPLFRVENRSARQLIFVWGWFYYYDADRRQIARRYWERHEVSVPGGGSEEFVAGPPRAELPSGTAHIEAVFVGGTFAGGAGFRGDPKTLAPDVRPMSGR